MSYIDAHNHLQDASLDAYRELIIPELEALGITRAVVNGTREADWADVAELAQRYPWVQPSFGLHPWHAKERRAGCLDRLRDLLLAHPAAGVGEIGLDRWIAGHDDFAQAEAFTAQLLLAAHLNRPATIHCLKSWGALMAILRSHPLPACGFLIHAYGGSLEMMHEFVLLGGYFSFNAYFLHERKGSQREVFAKIPAERLLVETDAPSMPPPVELNRHPLHDAAGAVINSPLNIALAYEGLARIRGVSVEELQRVVQGNFTKLFGPTG